MCAQIVWPSARGNSCKCSGVLARHIPRGPGRRGCAPDNRGRGRAARCFGRQWRHGLPGQKGFYTASAAPVGRCGQRRKPARSGKVLSLHPATRSQNGCFSAQAASPVQRPRRGRGNEDEAGCQQPGEDSFQDSLKAATEAASERCNVHRAELPRQSWARPNTRFCDGRSLSSEAQAPTHVTRKLWKACQQGSRPGKCQKRENLAQKCPNCSG